MQEQTKTDKSFLGTLVLLDYLRGIIAVFRSSLQGSMIPACGDADSVLPPPPPQRYRLRDVFLGDFAFTDDGLR